MKAQKPQDWTIEIDGNKAFIVYHYDSNEAAKANAPYLKCGRISYIIKDNQIWINAENAASYIIKQKFG